jgi:hypothetical protein
MNSAFAWEVMCGTARTLADQVRSISPLNEETDWQMVLYLEHNLPPAPALHPPHGRQPEGAERPSPFQRHAAGRRMSRTNLHTVLPAELRMHIASEA